MRRNLRTDFQHERKKDRWGLSLVLFGILLGVSFLSEATGHGSICLIYNTTGFPCPTCGMTRAYLALLRGDLQGAVFYHPLFFLVPVLLYAMYFRRNRLLYALSVVFLLVYSYRMIFYFPHTEPMLYNGQSLWGWIINLLRKVF